MGSAERRARERNQTRELILGAARQIFLSDGLEALTMRRIAERIEYTPAAIYAHFKDKLDLIMALCESDFRMLRDAMREAEGIADPVERLRAAGYAYVDFALNNPHHYRFMFMSQWPEEAHELDPSRECEIAHGNPDQDAYAFLTLLVKGCIEAGRFAPEYHDADAVTLSCWGAAHGVVSLFVTHGQDQWVRFGDPREAARMLIDAHIRGLLAGETLAPATRPSRRTSARTSARKEGS